MGKRSSETCGLCGIALVLALGTVNSLAVPAEGYLAKVGPVPLRFQEVHPLNLMALPPLAMDDGTNSDTNSIPDKVCDDSLASAGLASSSAGVPQAFFAPASTWLNRLSTLDDTNAPQAGFGIPLPESAPPRPAASDLLAMTPQMFMDYFKPLQSGTNGAGIAVQFPVEFMPATPPATPASSATYRTPAP